MISTVTQQFKEIVSKDGRTFRGKVVINNVEYKEFREFKITMSCESNNSLSFGSTYSSKIEITLANVQNSIYIDAFKGQKIDLYIGLKIDSSFDTFDDENVYEWVKMGEYNIQSPKLNDSDLSFTAFDNFYKCDQGFFTNLSGMQYVRDIVSEQCLKIGIEYVNDIEEVQYNIDVLKGLTIREAFGYLASYLGKNAIFNEEGKLKFIWYDVIDKTIDSDRFSSPLDIGNEYIIRGLKCNTRNETISDGITTYEDSTLTVGESEYLTFDNLFMTEERLLVLLERINGMTIMSCSLNWTMAEPHIQPGDIVEIKDTNGSVYNVPIMDIEINIDGGCYGTLKSKYESNNDVSNTFGGSLSEKVNRIYQETASFKDVMADRMKAITGEFETVNTDILNVYKELNAQKVIVNEIDTKYAKIDFSNVGTEYVDEIFGKSSFFEKTTIEEATIYELKNVTFEGDLIKSNTIVADKLLIKGENGLYYRLNAEGGHLTKEQLTDEKYKNYLDGTNIVAKSITTDQLNVNKLSAITSNLGDINGGSININNRFIVDNKGNMSATSGDFSGKINSNEGTIGGWTISDIAIENTIDSEDKHSYARIDSSTNSISFSCQVKNVTEGTSVDYDTTYSWEGISMDFGTGAHSFKNAYISPDSVSMYNQVSVDENSDISISTKGISFGGYFLGNDYNSSLDVDSTGRLTIKATNNVHFSGCHPHIDLGNKIYFAEPGYKGNPNIRADLYNDTTNLYLTSVDGYLALYSNSLACYVDGVAKCFKGSGNGVWTLGTSSGRWGQIYSSKSTISTSDRNLKKNIHDIDERYLNLAKDLKPVSYMYKNGDRIHTGFIAQDVEESMKKHNISAMDFGAYCKDQKYSISYDKETGDEILTPIECEYELSLRYEEFIPLAFAYIHDLEKKLDTLENKYNQLLGEVA